MAPLQHHFEMKAWSETKIMVRFWIVTAIFCAAGFALFYKYYPNIRRPLRGARLRPRAVGRLVGRAADRARGRGRAVDRTLGNEDDLGAARRRRRWSSRARACRARRRSSRGARARRRRCGRRSSSACRLLRRRALRRRHRDERQDDDGRAARRDLPRRRAGRRGRRATSARRSRRSSAAEWVVCELSSFQLEDVHELACDVAVLLNLEPDHLDRHGSFEAYRDAKLRIFERARAKVVPRGLGLDGIEFSADDQLPAEPLMRGAHNRENAAAATAAARAAGIARRARSPRGCARFPACRTGSSSSPSATASASSTTRRRRTSPPRGARSPRMRTSRCT